MNSPKIIKALEEAEAKKIRRCQYSLYSEEEEAFCAVGWLAYKAGFSKQDLVHVSKTVVEDPVYKRFEQVLKEQYDLDILDRERLEMVNDKSSIFSPTSWKSVIERV